MFSLTAQQLNQFIRHKPFPVGHNSVFFIFGLRLRREASAETAYMGETQVLSADGGPVTLHWFRNSYDTAPYLYMTYNVFFLFSISDSFTRKV